MDRAVLYARVSGDDRDRESLDVQLRMCRDRALDRGWTVVAELAEDERTSGAAADAPQLNRALAMAKAGEFDVLIVREMDRLARSLAKQILTEDRLGKAGVRIDYVLGEYPDTPEGQLQKHVRAVVADYERLKIAERVQRGLRESARRGNVICAGRPPYGYRQVVDDAGVRRLEVDEDEAAVVRRMFDWYCHGDGDSARLSIDAITKKLSARRVLSPADKRRNPAGKMMPRGTWASSTVTFILSNPTYAGTWRYHSTDGTRISVPVPAIVGEDVFALAQRRRVEARQSATRNLKREYLVRRRVRCGGCGYAMQAFASPSRDPDFWYLYYRCKAHLKDTPRGRCEQRSVRADHLDARVWGLVASLFSEPGALRRAWERWREGEGESSPLRDDLERAEGELKRLASQRERLLDVYLDGGTAAALYRQRRDRIEDRLQALRAERRRLVDAIEEADSSGAVETLEDFAAQVGDEIAGTGDYAGRLWYVETLDVQVVVGLDRVALVTAHGVLIGEIEGV